MRLRPLNALTLGTRRRLALVGVAVLALGPGAGGIDASGTASYPSPLYLSGATSTLLSGSNTLVTSAGPGVPASAPTAAAGAAGVLSGTYQYAYTVVDPTGGETAVSPSSTGVTVTSKAVTVGNLPTGVTVRVYRFKTGFYTRVAELANNSSATYSDNMDDATAATQPVLPQAQNRIPLSTTGYQDFSPGNYAPLTATTAVSGSASTTPNGKGWIVDGGGAVSFPTNTWTFQIKLKQNTSFGAARLVVGMWKVSVSGGAISSSTLLVDPTCATAPCASGAAPGENTTSFNLGTNLQKLISHAVSVNGFSLAANEHLYVQFWRKQQTAMTVGSAANELATLFAYDGTAQISHPAATPLPNVPALGSVAARVKTTPQLSGTYSDPADTGTLSFQLCSDSACTTVLQSGSSAAGLTNGATGSWTPAALTDGVYYWRAQATDGAGNASAWASTASFTVDSVAPGTPTLVSPAGAARVASPQLTATFTDADAGDTGTLTFQLCSDAACSSVAASSTSSSTANGANASWTPSVADGAYWWRVQAQDAATNASAWSSTRAITIDTTSPSAAALDAPADGAALAALPSLGATFSDPDAGDTGTLSFQICTDSACNNVAASGTSASLANGAHTTWSPSTLADGAWYARVRAQDVAGNAAAWSATRTFTLDTTPPATPTTGGIADGTRTKVAPTLTATFSDPGGTPAGTVAFQLCSDSACAHVVSSSTPATANGATASWTPAPADGAYWWRARATDAVGLQSAWSGTTSFVMDTVSPAAPALLSPAGSARVSSAQLSATFSDPDAGDSGTLSFQLCSDATCASVVASGTSSSLANGASASWTPGGVADGAYWWRVQAQDAAANASAWSAARPLVVDTVAPTAPALDAPADAAALSALPSLGATFADADVGDSGTLDFQICADAACTSVAASGASATLAGGTHGTWQPSSLADGPYYARVRAQDAAGNATAWSATRSFTLDTTAPAAPTTGGIADGTRTAHAPTLTAGYADPGGTPAGTIEFQLCSDSRCTRVVGASSAGGVANGAASSWTPTLSDGAYYWRARATDAVGWQSAWSPTTAFVVDTLPPGLPTLVSTDGLRVQSPPLLVARPGAAGPGDSARTLIALCADPSCALVLGTRFDADGSGWQPAALADGTYYWRALSEDVAGNQSLWSAPSSFTIDTVAPAPPALESPAADAVLASPELAATSPDGVALSFQVCTDAECATVVASGSAAAAGTDARWTASGLGSGSYFWRASARDAAGNVSAWSDTRSFTLDVTPPGKVKGFSARLAGRMLTLSWQAPLDAGATGYVLFVNGSPARTIDADTLSVGISLRPGDKRSFAVAAVDASGNVGPRTRAIVLVPKLVHLTLNDAKAQAAGRNLILRWAKGANGAAQNEVVAQTPDAASLLEEGSSVTVVVGAAQKRPPRR